MHDSTIALSRVSPARSPKAPACTPALASSTWRQGLPTLRGRRLCLRELCLEDASALVPLLTAPDVTRFMSPPPQAPDWFSTFIAATAAERHAGRYAGFAVVPHGEVEPVGLVQIRRLDPDAGIAEWGIALGSEWWGKGLFEDAGRLVLGFAFDTLGAHRLEARVASQNARGNAAVTKLGAIAEGVLRRALRTSDGTTHDQVLYSWLDDEWRRDEARRMAEELVWVH